MFLVILPSEISLNPFRNAKGNCKNIYFKEEYQNRCFLCSRFLFQREPIQYGRKFNPEE
jgi:hypothetical protein